MKFRISERIELPRTNVQYSQKMVFGEQNELSQIFNGSLNKYTQQTAVSFKYYYKTSILEAD